MKSAIVLSLLWAATVWSVNTPEKKQPSCAVSRRIAAKEWRQEELDFKKKYREQNKSFKRVKVKPEPVVKPDPDTREYELPKKLTPNRHAKPKRAARPAK